MKSTTWGEIPKSFFLVLRRVKLVSLFALDSQIIEEDFYRPFVSMRSYLRFSWMGFGGGLFSLMSLNIFYKKPLFGGISPK